MVTVTVYGGTRCVNRYRYRIGLSTEQTFRETPLCFVVIDSAGQKLAYVYFEDEPGRRSAAKLLTEDVAVSPSYRSLFRKT